MWNVFIRFVPQFMLSKVTEIRDVFLKINYEHFSFHSFSTRNSF